MKKETYHPFNSQRLSEYLGYSNYSIKCWLNKIYDCPDAKMDEKMSISICRPQDPKA